MCGRYTVSSAKKMFEAIDHVFFLPWRAKVNSCNSQMRACIQILDSTNVFISSSLVFFISQYLLMLCFYHISHSYVAMKKYTSFYVINLPNKLIDVLFSSRF